MIAKKDNNDEPDEIVKIKKVSLSNEQKDSISAAVVMDPSDEIKRAMSSLEKNVASSLTKEMKFEHLVE